MPDLGTAPAVFEIGLILLLAVIAAWLCRRLGLPAIIGYLLVGVAVSPFTPGYIANRGDLELLADVGAVLLLFEVGIEIDPLRLGRGGRGLLLIAPVQVVAKGLPIFLLASLARLPSVRPWQLAVGLGQVGEFSFVLATIVLGRSLIPAELFTAFLATMVVTIAVSTVLVRLGKKVDLTSRAQPATS